MIEHLATSNNYFIFVKSIQQYLKYFITDEFACFIIIKCLKVMDEGSVEPIVKFLASNAFQVSIHKFGCGAIQQIIDAASINHKKILMRSVIKCSYALMFNKQGRFVVYLVVLRYHLKDILDEFAEAVLKSMDIKKLCMHFYTCKLVKKCMEFSQYGLILINRITNDFKELAVDQHGSESK